ncbi:hypothetical protein G6F22_013320 [Rhizopus arrhizus]|nr:hypothetical protein G6F22_013320 [Rhizopus arrhizus]
MRGDSTPACSISCRTERCGSVQKRQVDLARGQLRLQHGGRIDLDLDHQGRIAVVQILHQRGQPGVDDRLGDAQPERAAHDALGGRGLLHVAPQLQHALGVGQQFTALARKLDAAGVAIEQADAQVRFQRRDALRNGRLRRVQLFSGSAEPAQGGNPEECFDIRRSIMEPASRVCPQRVQSQSSS